MMRRLLLMAALALTAAAATAQQAEEICFSPAMPADSASLSDGARKMLRSKVGQILNRCSAAAGGRYGAFTVVPRLHVGDVSSTSGLVQNFSSLSGELVLTAANAADGAEYYSVTVPLKATAKSTGADAAETLARAIKVTDPVYVRFVRTARQNIEAHFAAHCDEMVERAKSIYASGNIDGAIELLTAIPASASCHDDALELLGALGAKRERDRQQSAATPQPAVPTEPAEPTEPETTPEMPQPDSEIAQPDIYISQRGWNVKLTGCKYEAVNRRVDITVVITATEEDLSSVQTVAIEAFNTEGDSYTTYGVLDDRFYRSYPEGVPCRVTFTINRVKQNPEKIVLFKFRLASTVVELRNLTVTQ